MSKQKHHKLKQHTKCSSGKT